MTKTDNKSPVKTQQHFGTNTRRRMRLDCEKLILRVRNFLPPLALKNKTPRNVSWSS